MDEVSDVESSGFGVRVLARGTWGFACTPSPTSSVLAETVVRALAVARASAGVAKGTVRFPERGAEVGRYATPFERDPFDVPLDDKLAALLEPLSALLRGAGRAA